MSSRLYVPLNGVTKAFLAPIQVDVPPWIKRKLEAEGKPIPKPYRTKALIDTGAKACGATPKLINDLQLPTTSSKKHQIFTGNGAIVSLRYSCSFKFEDEPAIGAMAFPMFMYKMENPHFEFIIGMEFLENYKVNYTPGEKGLFIESSWKLKRPHYRTPPSRVISMNPPFGTVISH